MYRVNTQMVQIFSIAILSSILQLTALTYARIGPYTFNLDLIVLVFFSLRYGLKLGIALGLFFGIFNGIFSINSFWLNCLLYAAVGSVIGYLGRWFYREHLPVFLLMIFCSLAFIYFFTYILDTSYPNPQSNILTYFIGIFAPSALYNLAVSTFLFYFLRELKI